MEIVSSGAKEEEKGTSVYRKSIDMWLCIRYVHTLTDLFVFSFAKDGQSKEHLQIRGLPSEEAWVGNDSAGDLFTNAPVLFVLMWLVCIT